MTIGFAQGPMSERELLALCDKEIRLAETPSDVSNDRIKFMEYYLSRPYGKLVAKEGHSQLVSRTMMDVIEWVMPLAMEILCTNPKAVQFKPLGKEDVDAAEQETDYISHVYWDENTGYLNTYAWLKDGLLLKNGYVKAWWDDKKEVTQHTYKHLTMGAVQMLLSDQEVQPIEANEYQELEYLPKPMPDGRIVMMPTPVTYFDVTVLRTTIEGCEKIEPVPPEELRISNDCKSPFLNEARCVAHVRLVSRSELVEMGIPVEVVEKLPTHGGRTQRDTREKRARHADVRSRYDVTYDQGEGAMAVVEVREAYIKVDFDGDGIAERRRVLYSGKELLINEWVSHVPFYNWSPIMMTHRHVGIGYGDVMTDLHEAYTVLTRQIFDNIYRTNNPEIAYDKNGVDDENEWMVSQIGGRKATNRDPNTVFAPVEVPFTAEKSLLVTAMLDKQRMERTGTGPDAIAQDPDTLKNVNTGVAAQALSMAVKRVYQVVRNFAEVGMRSAWLGIHQDLKENQNQRKQVELSGKWTEVHPAHWRRREHMKVNVGLAAGMGMEQLMHLDRLYDKQTEIYQAQKPGEPQMVTGKHLHNTLGLMVEAAGFGNYGADYFFQDPTDPKVVQQAQRAKQAQGPSVDEQLVQVQREALQVEAQDNATDNIIEFEKLRSKEREVGLKHEQAMTKLELEHSTDVPGSAV